MNSKAAMTFTAVALLGGCAAWRPVAVPPSLPAEHVSVARVDVERLERRLERVEARQDEAQAELARISREHVEQVASALGTMTTQLERLQADLRDRLARIDERQQGLGVEVAELSRSVSEARTAEASALSQRLETVADAVAALSAQVDGLHAELRAARLQPAVAPQVAVPATPARPSTPPAEARPGTERHPRDLYEAAYTDYSRGNYALAIGGFREFLRQHPDDSDADNAQYWIGEAYLGLAQRYQNQNEDERTKQALQEAGQAFRHVVERYPNGDKVTSALYREALVLLEMQEPVQARARLQYLLVHFPTAPEAPAARERISQLGEP
jgi:TolA-binding protein